MDMALSYRAEIMGVLQSNLERLSTPDLIALNLIVSERDGQIVREGWTLEHDEHHRDGDLALAAAVYAKISADEIQGTESKCPSWWPWAKKWFKPKGFQRNLERSGALILAELSRLIRA